MKHAIFSQPQMSQAKQMSNEMLAPSHDEIETKPTIPKENCSLLLLIYSSVTVLYVNRFYLSTQTYHRAVTVKGIKHKQKENTKQKSNNSTEVGVISIITRRHFKFH